MVFALQYQTIKFLERNNLMPFVIYHL